MIECLRRGEPRRTELLVSLKTPLVAALAYIWLHETPTKMDFLGSGVCLAVFFGHKEGSKSGATVGHMSTIIILGITATRCQGFGFLVMKPAMIAGSDPLAGSAIHLLGRAFSISLIALWPAKIFRPRSKLASQLLGQMIVPGFIGYGISSSLLLFALTHFDVGIATVLGPLSSVRVLPILWVKDGLVPHVQAILGAVLAMVGTTIIIILYDRLSAQTHLLSHLYPRTARPYQGISKSTQTRPWWLAATRSAACGQTTPEPTIVKPADGST